MESVFNPYTFTLMSMFLVFLGLGAIALLILYLAKFIDLGERAKGLLTREKKSAPVVASALSSSTTVKSDNSALERQNMVVAVATALFLDQQSQGNMKLTGERHEVIESTWRLGGRVNAMRPQNPWQNNIGRRC